MNDKIAMAKHANSTSAEAVNHLNLRSRFTSALVAGTLALTLCPAAAFAAQPGQGAPDQGSSAPAMQQQLSNDFGAPQQGGSDGSMFQQGNADFGSFEQGSAPDMQQGGSNMPDAQQNNGGMPGMQQGGDQRQPMSDALSDQIRQILADAYGIALPDFLQAGENGQAPSEGAGMPGNPGEAPELPEGSVNVQAVIDSVRDVFREYSVADLEAADFTNDEFKAELEEYVKAATQERLEMFAQHMFQPGGPAMPPAGQAPDGNFEAPSDLPAPAEGGETPQAPDGQAPEVPQAPDGSTTPDGTAAPEGGAPDGAQAPEGDAPEAPGTGASASLIDQLVSFVMGIFGMQA